MPRALPAQGLIERQVERRQRKPVGLLGPVDRAEQVRVVGHRFRHAEREGRRRGRLLGLGQAPGDNEVLDALGLPNGFEAMNQEEAEFMIDLMDTLLD